MSYCLNPDCSQPQNSDINFCQSCGKILLLRQRYRAVRQIGQGGFGKTFLAVDQDLPNKPACVIKQFSPQIQGASGLQKATELFEQEAVQLNILGKHPQIPELLAHFEQDGRLYLVQEYVKGRNLAEELAQDGAFSEAKIRELLIGLLPVLQYIHDNQVIHRDIKPENIIRRDDGMLFLVDFGAVKLMTGTALLGTGTVIGDPRYMSPEQLRGKADGSSDLYALGVTCLHLITDVDPLNLFDDAEGEWVWRDYLSSSVGLAIAALLDKMVVRAMKKRYISASKVLSDLGTRSEIVVSEYSESQVISEKVSAIQIQSLERVQIGKKYGYENESGQVVTKQLFDYARSFSEGLAEVELNGKWGFINATGEFGIPPQFDETSEFSDGLARVKLNDKWGIINVTGRYEGIPQFDEINKFSDGLARVKLQGKYCFINKKGDIVLRPNFDFCDDFREGLALVIIESYGKNVLYNIRDINYIMTSSKLAEKLEKIGIDTCFYQLRAGKYGFINKNGEVVISPQFDIARSFDNGTAIFGMIKSYYNLSKNKEGMIDLFRNTEYGLVNKNGKIIVKPSFNDIGFFNNGQAQFCKAPHTYGFIDCNGKILIQIDNCRELDGFSEGLAAFHSLDNDRWGYIDVTGKVIIEPMFNEAEYFKNGYAKVKVRNWFVSKWRTIDKTGKFVD
ncbi:MULTISPECIES: WG repeat-containing protein [Pseudanabaena]|uniref:Serine/threonine protein kinase n=2 Tax=Pseudanabaena TaxID=1152 RepID=L8MX85_9CYAN|nr:MULTISPECIES: WG repeat-containing protein [Pseudanabaena]ELS31409.1 serine/threonine protein kinase [Pseudanabaena biceps PCC 7429]MDG3496332.1 WG repeat-containing protein [Pseudanabaena catenata USMAC16]